VSAPLAKTPVLIRGGSIVPTRERPRRSANLMRRDPLTLTVALDKAGAARGELYLDAGDGYAHRAGAFVWRAFEAATHGGALRLSSADLAARDPRGAVEGAALEKYDAAGNEYARGEAAAVGVERVVVLGLEKKPAGVRVEGGAELAFEWTKGAGAGSSKTGAPSKLVVKSPPVGVVQDWVIVIA
jgi:alpha 1,3-glucosidase